MYSINKKPDAVLVDYRLPNKMKMKIDFVLPLSRQVILLLKNIYKY